MCGIECHRISLDIFATECFGVSAYSTYLRFNNYNNHNNFICHFWNFLYSKALAAAKEQRVNLCACPLWHWPDANTWPSPLIWFPSTCYVLCYRGNTKHCMVMDVCFAYIVATHLTARPRLKMSQVPPQSLKKKTWSITIINTYYSRCTRFHFSS